jgi:hypothetical protein
MTVVFCCCAGGNERSFVSYLAFTMDIGCCNQDATLASYSIHEIGALLFVFVGVGR